MKEINVLKDVKKKELSTEEINAIVSHWFNHQEIFLKRDLDKITQLIQHIAFMEGDKDEKPLNITSTYFLPDKF